MSSSNGAKSTEIIVVEGPNGPIKPTLLAITPVKGTREERGEGKSGGVWRVTWPEGQMFENSWAHALTFLDKLIRNGDIDNKDVILAGEFAAPWILEHYINAAFAIEYGYIDGAFTSWDESAKILYGKDSKYDEHLRALDDAVLGLDHASSL